MGDIHGGYKALVQCMERAKFDYELDTLIQLGDVADGWSEVPECVDLLLKVKNLIAIKGNHDEWAREWMLFGTPPHMWLKQGGQATYDAYRHDVEMKADHYTRFFNKQHNYYHDEENDRVFVHGGYVDAKGIGHDHSKSYYWDRELWSIALSGKSSLRGKVSKAFTQKLPRRLRAHKEIYIGHTTTLNWKTDKPMKACNVWNLDTGGGFGGKLTIMDVDTKEYWQSDKVEDLYPDEDGR